jgi:hypothetical protein
MTGQPGFFDCEEQLKALSASGDPLERLARVVDFEAFRENLEKALLRSDRARGGRPPYDAVLMFKVLVLQTLYTLSDEQTEYQLKDRLSFMRFVGLALRDPVQLARAGAAEKHRCDGDRSAEPAAKPGGEGHDRGWRHSGRVDTGPARADRPGGALDHQARQEARNRTGREPEAAGRDRRAGVRLQKPHRHRPRVRLSAALHHHPRGGA